MLEEYKCEFFSWPSRTQVHRMLCNGPLRLARITFFVPEYLPRLHGFETMLTNGASSGAISSKYNCKAITVDLRYHEISKVSFKVDRMMSSFQCYTGVRLHALKGADSVESLVFEQEFAQRGEWQCTDIPDGERFVGFYGHIYDQFYVTQLGCLTVKRDFSFE